jgi:hypothetical protein
MTGAVSFSKSQVMKYYAIDLTQISTATINKGIGITDKNSRQPSWITDLQFNNTHWALIRVSTATNGENTIVKNALSGGKIIHLKTLKSVLQYDNVYGAKIEKPQLDTNNAEPSDFWTVFSTQ